jgi:thiamine-monophosphate kinase
MSRIGEFGIIDRYFTRPNVDPEILTGIGDDAAIVAPSGPLAIAVDMLVAGTHFPPQLDARAIGHRALAVNLSDLAAVGARARWATLALSLPEAEPDWLQGFADGFFALAERYDVALIGGDTTRGPLTITVEVIGDAPARPLLRSAGRPGYQLFVTGTLGDSAAALEFFARSAADRPAEAAALIERFSYPEPRLALGGALAELGAAAIDVSDGLLADLGHLCRASACGAAIDSSRLPLSAALRSLYAADVATGHALQGGDDYELCFAVAPEQVERVLLVARATATPVTMIGSLTADPGLVDVRADRPVKLAAAGFTHF